MRYATQEFKDIVLRWQEPVFQVVTRITGDPEATEVLAQNVFVRLWFSRRWRSVGETAIMQIAVDEAVRHLHCTGRQVPSSLRYRTTARCARAAAAIVLAAALFAGAAFAQRPGRGGGRQGPSPSSEQTPPLPKTEAEKKILATIDQAVSTGALYANVPAADGRMLRMLTEAVNAKHVVEIGTSTGLSGMWFAMGLGKTGGKLTTFEYDAQRAATARKHFAQAGVDKLITLIEGDAHVNITKLKEPIDIVFIDADKEGYVDYLNKLLPLVKPGGLLLAHNVDMVPDYMKAVTTSPDLETTVYTTGGGLAITLKKR